MVKPTEGRIWDAWDQDHSGQAKLLRAGSWKIGLIGQAGLELL
jgi:hypothetical protein